MVVFTTPLILAYLLALYALFHIEIENQSYAGKLVIASCDRSDGAHAHSGSDMAGFLKRPCYFRAQDSEFFGLVDGYQFYI